MTDQHLAAALLAAEAAEQHAREAMGSKDLVERESALAVVRLTTPLRRQLEGWIARRACRTVAQASL